jgi:hypothetical protein
VRSLKQIGHAARPAARKPPREIEPLPFEVREAATYHAGPARPGTVILHMIFYGRAIAWRVPNTHGRSTTKPARLARWQQAIALAVDRAGYGQRAWGMASRPYAHPVRVEMLFCRVCPRRGHQKPGDVCAVHPDGDNMGKALVDAISGGAFRKGRCQATGKRTIVSSVGRVLENDKRVVSCAWSKIYWHRDTVSLCVLAAGEGLETIYSRTLV